MMGGMGFKAHRWQAATLEADVGNFGTITRCGLTVAPETPTFLSASQAAASGLPLCPGCWPAALRAATPPTGRAVLSERFRFVMVVDDDPDIRESMETLLKVYGYPVMVVADGAEALIHLRNGARPCLILLDLMMPGMNGFELSEHLAADPELAKIPLVVITGAGPAVAEKARALQVEVMRKPFELTTLLSTVARYRPSI
jgi:CheY-like chemotaxis protein